MRRLTAVGMAAFLGLGPALATAPAQGGSSGFPGAADRWAAQIVAASPASGLAAPASKEQSSGLVNDEIVVAQLDPRGLPEQAQLISRISSNGGEQRTVFDPTATANIEYLNQRGRPEVNGAGIDVQVGGPEPVTILTEAIVDKPLPVAIHAEYRRDGEIVNAEDIVGQPGDIEVAYTLTNIDVKQQKITYTDSAGNNHTQKQPIFAPFVGTLTATLPQGLEATDTTGAVVTTDREGNTILQWSLLLYPPLGSYQQTVSFKASTDSGSVPGTVLNVMPVEPSQDPAVAFSDSLLEKSVAGNDQLASGLDQLNNQTIALANGAAQLSDGIAQLATGTATVSSGVDSELVPGIAGLAAGAAVIAGGQSKLTTALGAAATGAGQLTTGADGLVAGLKRLAAGLDGFAGTAMPALTDGATKIGNGADQLADAVGSPDDPPIPFPSPSLPLPPSEIPTPNGTPVFPSATPSPTITPTLEQLVRATVTGTQVLVQQTTTLSNHMIGITASIGEAAVKSTDAGDDAGAAAAALTPLLASLCPPPGPLTQPQCDALGSAQQDARSAATTSHDVADSLTATAQSAAIETVRAYGIAFGSNALLLAVKAIKKGVDQVSLALRSGSSKPGDEGLVEALDALVAGLEKATSGAKRLSDGATEAVNGAEELAGGNSKLASGLDQTASGSARLDSGTAAMAAGAQQLAFGGAQVAAALNQLTAGADTAASGSAELAAGSSALQKQGTEKIYETVVESSQKPALANAWLKAANDRAPEALPYGLPAGATGSAAYVLTMEPVQTTDNTPWQLAAVGLVVLAAIAGAVLKQLASHSAAAAVDSG